MKHDKNKISKQTFSILTVILIFVISLPGIILCRDTQEKKEQESVQSYLEKIKEWRQNRLEELKATDGWLSLAGLFWLKEGKNTFGSAPANDLVVTEVKAPALIGSFFLEKGQVRFVTAAGAAVLCDGKAVSDISLKSDQPGETAILRAGSLSWHIIERGERIGVRLRDANHPRIDKLKEIETFPVDLKWRVEATLERFEKPQIIKVPTVLGTENEALAPGVLVFEIAGEIYRLTPLGENGDLFVVFGDETNAIETYGGGRFLGVGKPDEKGRTVIDFNMATNPPCAFSPHATCPLPPKMNRLSIRVTAGEKTVKEFTH